jgi:hypothetical protein
MGLIRQPWRPESILKYNVYLVPRTINWDTNRFLPWLPDMQITCMWHHFVMGSIDVIGWQRGQMPLQYFFYLWTVQSVKKVCVWGARGGKAGMFIKDWFRRILHVLLNWLLFKLKFLIPMVDFWLPNVISKVIPMIRSLQFSLASADSVKCIVLVL